MVLIDEQYRKIVAFLCQDIVDPETGQNKRIPVATAFLIGVKPGTDDPIVVYAITALHCIFQSRANGTLYLRINTRDGNYVDRDVPQDSWVTHDTSDVALIQVEVENNFDIAFLPMRYIATDDIVAQHSFGIGDEVFFVSLFVRHTGENRVLPIIRFGNIAMMPDEPIRIKIDPYANPVTVDAYLVEARSWGGQSGAPAFIHFPPDRHPGVLTLPEWPLKEPQFYLLGLVHGHFDIPTGVEFAGDLENYGTGKVPINAGVGIIIPAQDIFDLIMRPDLVDQRER